MNDYSDDDNKLLESFKGKVILGVYAGIGGFHIDLNDNRTLVIVPDEDTFFKIGVIENELVTIQ